MAEMAKTEVYNDYKVEIGKVGEETIRKLIEEQIEVYHKIISNVILDKNGKKTEVDIILITCFGIYVIESKNFSGTIYGTDTDEVWTEWFPNKTFCFDNPIKQNEYHIEYMVHNVKHDPRDFYSYIVFGDNAKLQKISLSEANLQVRVINAKNLVECLIEDMHSRDIVLSHEEIDKMYIDLKYFYSHLER